MVSPKHGDPARVQDIHQQSQHGLEELAPQTARREHDATRRTRGQRSRASICADLTLQWAAEAPLSVLSPGSARCADNLLGRGGGGAGGGGAQATQQRSNAATQQRSNAALRQRGSNGGTRKPWAGGPILTTRKSLLWAWSGGKRMARGRRGR